MIGPSIEFSYSYVSESAPNRGRSGSWSRFSTTNQKPSSDEKPKNYYQVTATGALPSNPSLKITVSTKFVVVPPAKDKADDELTHIQKARVEKIEATFKAVLTKVLKDTVKDQTKLRKMIVGALDTDRNMKDLVERGCAKPEVEITESQK